MSVSLAAKLGGGLTTTGAAGLAVTSYVYSDHFFLYKSERDAISAETVVVSESENTDPTITSIKLSSDAGNKWTCIIKAKLDTGDSSTPTLSSKRSDLTNKIKEKLPIAPVAGTSDTNKEQKLKNKENLVRNCSKDKSKTVSDGSVTSTIFVTITGSGDSAYSFKDENLKELFN